MANPENRSIFDQVAEFQTEVLNNPRKPTPVRILTNSYKTNTQVFIAEELEELRAALNADNLPETLDALVDLMYFAAGAIHNLGVDGDEAFRRVHHANMAKSLGVKPTRGLSGDAIKAADWAPPTFDDMFD